MIGLIRRSWRRVLRLFDGPDVSEAWMRNARIDRAREELRPPDSVGQAPTPSVNTATTRLRRDDRPADDSGAYRWPWRG